MREIEGGAGSDSVASDAMKLAALGLVTAVIGVALAVPGLIWIGAFWVAIGPLMRMHGQKIKDLQATTPEDGSAAAGTAERRPTMDGRTFAVGTLLWLLLGIPSLAVGVLELGISVEHGNWRWLPIAVGGLALGIGGISAVLYLAGGAVLAVAERGPKSEIPATIWIRAVRETGTFINERPRLEFELLVEPEAATGVTKYEVTKKATVPFTALSALRVGDGFKALVAGPENPRSMEIRWDEPVSAGTQARADHADAARPPGVSSRLEELDRLHRDAEITDEEYQAQRERILGSL